MKRFTLFIFLFALSEFVIGQIYTADKKFEYDIKYFQSQGNQSSHERIILTMTGKKWKVDESQLEGIWTYFTKPKTEKKFKKQKSNRVLKEATTGVIENEKKNWLHSPRHNQYFLTEISPFPDFRKNLKVGESYNTILFIGKGFGDFTDKKIKFKYVIKSSEVHSTDTLWTIEATSIIDEKTNSCNFIFSEKRGFIWLDYNFYNGDKLLMQLR